MSKQCFFCLAVLGLAVSLHAQRIVLTGGMHTFAAFSRADFSLQHAQQLGGYLGAGYPLGHQDQLTVILGYSSNQPFITNAFESRLDVVKSDFVYRKYRKANELMRLYLTAGPSLVRARWSGLTVPSAPTLFCDCNITTGTLSSTRVIMKSLLIGGVTGLGLSVEASPRLTFETELNGGIYMRRNGYQFLTPFLNFAFSYQL